MHSPLFTPKRRKSRQFRESSQERAEQENYSNKKLWHQDFQAASEAEGAAWSVTFSASSRSLLW